MISSRSEGFARDGVRGRALRSTMRIFRPLIRLATATLALAALVLAPSLIDAASLRSPVNVLAGGRVAIHGSDPVAYFVEGGPRKGRPELAVKRKGARWLFSSPANKTRSRPSRS